MSQMQLLKIPLDQQDVVYTPDWVASDMVSFFQPSGVILEPCKGDGVFLKYLPSAEWCEIQEGRDFYAWNTPVNWVIGNPPYKTFSEWMRHSMELAQNICYVIATNKPFNSGRFILDWFEYGKIKHMRYYGRSGSIGFKEDMGWAMAAFHFQKGYQGPMYSSKAAMPSNTASTRLGAGAAISSNDLGVAPSG